MTANKVKVSWNRAGYAALLSSAAVQDFVTEKAEQVKEAATSMLDRPDGHEGRDPYVVRTVRGYLAPQRFVKTYTRHAYNSNLKHNDLIKALRRG